MGFAARSATRLMFKVCVCVRVCVCYCVCVRALTTIDFRKSTCLAVKSKSSRLDVITLTRKGGGRNHAETAVQ